MNEMIIIVSFVAFFYLFYNKNVCIALALRNETLLVFTFPCYCYQVYTFI